jgi:prepilin signal peptidase PulO-like enzyme (type II secretory pathway)
MENSWIIWGFIAVVGAAIGSFLTLATYRLPRDEKIGMTRSRCPACGTSLTVWDLFPIVSWIGARGKCRHCNTRVSMRYPLTELACALGAVAAAYRYGFTLEACAVTGLWWCIVAIIVTDLEHYIILDEVQIAIIVFGVLYHYALGTDSVAVISAGFLGLAIGLVLKYGFLYLRNKDGLGLGDVKLLFGVGIWLASGISFVPFLFMSGVLGVVFGLGWRLMGRGEVFPFGPALAIALLLGIVWPDLAQQFWQLYGFVGNDATLREIQ